MNENLKVSTIITTYRRADMLKRAIDSVLNQTYSNIEVIVVDDNDEKSEDRKNTEEIMTSYANNPKVKYIKDKLKLKIPFINQMMILVITTRFCRTLNILVESGVQIVDAIDISSRALDNIIVYEKLSISREHIRRGNDISYSISKSEVFSNSFISMLRIGEESGSLDETLSVTNDFYSEELNIKIEKAMKSVEPIITLVIGLIIGLFIIAMVIPMFDAINSIQ